MILLDSDVDVAPRFLPTAVAMLVQQGRAKEVDRNGIT
jgi:hypothetical protein